MFLNNKMKAKIFIVYHLNDKPIISDVFQPIAVGDNKDNFSIDFLRDDIGDNIADKNHFYNEMTSVYWVYKHIDECSSYDYIGFMHYRRLFEFHKLNKTAFVKKTIDPSYLEPMNDKIDNFFKDYDCLIPYPSHYKSVISHYKESHNKEDLDIILDIIKKDYPDFLKTANEYLFGKDEYCYNMFVFRKNDFLGYSQFVFEILEKFVDRKKDVDRLYVSERLTGIYITYLINKGYQPLMLPVVHIRDKSFSKALKQTKTNFKKGTDRGFIYKIKPLLLCLLPRWLEQIMRRRKTK